MDTRNCVKSGSVPEAATQRYERALAELAITSLPLTFRNATTKQLRHFIAAAFELRDACNNRATPEQPVDVLLWLRRRLNQESKNPEQSEFYRAKCLHEVSKVEREIEISCIKLSRGGLTVLE